MQYDYLQEYRYESVKAAEEFLSEEHPHFFIRKDLEAVEEGAAAIESKLNITLPQEMIGFWKNVGPGQFFCEPPDEYAGRYHMMSPDEILGVYFPEMDQYQVYNTIRADAKDFLEKYQLVAFCEFDEYSALYISLQADETGNYPVFSAPTIRIADSLEDFVNKLLEEPDYFLAEDEE